MLDEKVERYYAAKNFNLWKMKFGLMPPHPSSIIAKKTYQKNGFYNENFRIAGDFDLFLRFLNIKKISYKIIDKDLIRMRAGGVSGKNFLSYWISTIEILRSFKINNTKSNIFLILMRIPAKFLNYLYLIRINLISNLNYSKFYLIKITITKIVLKIINQVKQIPQEKNFILSGMNLAFLGYFSNNEVYPHKDLIHWPDGIWAQRHTNLKKNFRKRYH